MLVVHVFDRDTQYSVEELLGMVLEKSKEYAQDFAGMYGTFDCGSTL